MLTTTLLPSIAVTVVVEVGEGVGDGYGGHWSSGRHWKVKETKRMKVKKIENDCYANLKHIFETIN